MSTPLKVLIVEDSENDALLLQHELARGGYDVTAARVETEEEMRAALAGAGWDIVLSDYSLPRFNGISALNTLKQSGLDIPFVIVSGAIGEYVAVEAMKAGAHDYVMKDNLKRLVPTVGRELGEAQVHRDLRRIIKEQEAIRGQLIQSDKMAALGQMAAGMAHEVNNPLAVILGNVKFLLKQDIADTTKEVLCEIEQASQRCKQLVDDLLGFSKKRNIEMQECRLHELIDHVLHLSGYQSQFNDITVEKRYDPALPAVKASGPHIEQVFLNIINNATHAMNNKGKLCITTCVEAPFVKVSFADTGAGISPENMTKIFDPFFTTKTHGTGLGLALSNSIIQQHGGSIAVASPGEGRGCTFTVSLPLRPAEKAR